MRIRKVGIVGCGVMGERISQLCSQSGYDVPVSDKDENVLVRRLDSIEERLKKSFEKGKLSEQERNSILNRINGTTDIADFKDCDLIIEAVSEDLNLKRKVFADLGQICREEAILATNISVLSVIDIAQASGRSEKVVGMYFLTPAPEVKFLEIVRTLVTRNETLEVAKAFRESLGKVVMVVKNTPGFVINRLQTGFLLTAVGMVEEGVASRKDIDMAAKIRLSYPTRPLELLDLIGIDTVLKGADALYKELRDPQFRPPILMKKMVGAGRCGRKTGRGFYEYRD